MKTSYRERDYAFGQSMVAGSHACAQLGGDENEGTGHLVI